MGLLVMKNLRRLEVCLNWLLKNLDWNKKYWFKIKLNANSSNKGGVFSFDAQDGLKPSDMDVFVDFYKDVAIGGGEDISGFTFNKQII
ncbi:hypothetical protein [Metapseudomonas otitidis]|uniref:hypothetical protein n=1 Tax=Metapseudomonas otitidis TaxID=319939 RepID=UPI00366E963F